MIVQIFIKLACLEDNSVLCDKYVLHSLSHNTYACWNGIAFNSSVRWKKELYQYTLRISNVEKIEGTFTIY